MLSVPVSHVSPGPFRHHLQLAGCKDIVSVQKRHGETLFRTFVLQADGLNDFIKGEEARGNTVFVIAKKNPPLKEDVSLIITWSVGGFAIECLHMLSLTQRVRFEQHIRRGKMHNIWFYEDQAIFLRYRPVHLRNGEIILH